MMFLTSDVMALILNPLEDLFANERGPIFLFINFDKMTLTIGRSNEQTDVEVEIATATNFRFHMVT